MYADLTEALLAVVFLFFGVRLFRLSLRTGETPERFLGLTFLLWGASYALWLYERFFVASGPSHMALEVYYLCANFLSILAIFACALFLRAVFRDREGWALWLVIGDGALLVFALAGSFLNGDAGLYQPLSNPFYAIYFAGITLPLVWMMIEGFTQYGKSRKRAQLGLCSPVVCNRYLLIALASSSWVAYYGLHTLADMIYEQSGEWPSSINTGLLFTEIFAVAMFWLFFMAPDAYRRWVEGEAPPAAQRANP